MSRIHVDPEIYQPQPQSLCFVLALGLSLTAGCGGKDNLFFGSFRGTLSVVLESISGYQAAVRVPDQLANGSEGDEDRVQLILEGGGTDCHLILESDGSQATIVEIPGCDVQEGNFRYSLSASSNDVGAVSRQNDTITLVAQGDYRPATAGENGTFQLSYLGTFQEGTGP